MAEKKLKKTLRLFKTSHVPAQNIAEELRVILDSVPAMVFYKDKNNRFIRTNKAFEDIMGMAKTELEGHSVFDIYPKSQAKAFWKDDKEVMRSGNAKRGIIEPMRTNKGIRLVQTDKIPFANERGKVAGIVGFAIDVTKQKLAEKKMEHLASFPLLNPNPLIELNSRGQITYCNPATKNILKKIGAGQNARAFLPKDIAKIVKLLKLNKEGRVFNREVSIKNRVYGENIQLWRKLNFVRIYAIDITERKKKEEDLDKANRTLRAHNHVDQALTRAANEADYLKNVCKIITKDCGHAMVWIGFSRTDKEKSVEPVASSGFGEEYLKSLKITWKDTERGYGPTGTAIRTGKPNLCRNILTDPKFKPWRKQAIKHGYASSVVLPLMDKTKAFGAINIYSKKPDSFLKEEIKVLNDLAGDVSRGINSIRLRLIHAQAEDALRENEAGLKREGQILDTVMENTGANLAYLDTEFNFFWVNRQYAKSYGKKPEELIAKNYFSLKGHGKYEPTFKTTLETGQTAEFKAEPFDLPGHPRKGTTYWDWTLVPIKEASGKISGLVLSKIDVTETKLAEEEKNNFIAIMSHELRNPLTPITSGAQLIRNYLKNDPSRHNDKENILDETAEIIERQANNMTRLLDDLLDIARISRGKLQLKKQPVNLNKCLEETAKAARTLMKSQKHVFSISLPKTPIYLHADPVRLEQIVINLLNNAAKYTKAGGRVWLSAKKIGNKAVIRVRDTGIGIELEKVKSLFNSPHEISKPFITTKGEMGIGLQLTKKLIALHNGSIIAQSEGKNKGSEFIVTLPALAKNYAEADSKHKQLSVPQKRRRVLIIDDDPDIANILSRLLSNFNYETKTCNDGATALGVIKDYKPDIALIDIQMPEMNGYQLARKIKKLCGGSKHSPKLIALTGYGQEKDKKRSKAAGFNYHLVKPVTINSLINLLAKV